MKIGEREFTKRAKHMVSDYAVEHMDVTDDIPQFEVFIVWQCYILGNIKALLSTTLADGMYYEITYNGAKNEFYLDAYKKFGNRKISFEEDNNNGN